MKKNVWIMNHYAIEHLVSKGGRHFWLAEELKKNGYEPVVFGCNEKHNSRGSYFDDKPLWQEVYSETGVKYVPIYSSQYMGNGASRVKNMVTFALNLVKTAKQYAKKYGKPDIIYASSVHPLTVVAGEYLAHHFNVPCIGEVRDLWPETLVAYGALKRDSLFAKMLYMGEKYMYKWADAMVFTMEGAPDYIRERKWDTANGGPIDLSRVYHICNGTDIEQFDENRQKYILPDEHLDNPELFCAVYTGAIKRANNLGLLLEAAKYLKDIKNLRILVWGEGNEVETLTQKAKDMGLSDRFIFKGYVEKKYIPSIVSRADVNLAHSTSTELFRFGISINKLFDYLAAGKPIIADFASKYNPVIEYNAGVEVSNPSADDIASAIKSMTNIEKSEYEAYCKHARQAAFEFDFKKFTNKLIEIIENI